MGFLVIFRVHGAAATRRQYLALSRAWWSSCICVRVCLAGAGRAHDSVLLWGEVLPDRTCDRSSLWTDAVSSCRHT